MAYPFDSGNDDFGSAYGVGPRLQAAAEQEQQTRQQQDAESPQGVGKVAPQAGTILGSIIGAYYGNAQLGGMIGGQVGNVVAETTKKKHRGKGLGSLASGVMSQQQQSMPKLSQFQGQGGQQAPWLNSENPPIAEAV